MQTVSETPTFKKQSDRLLSEEERLEIVSYLAQHPMAGTVIPGTGGIRKVRVALTGRGKRGGARVVYYYLDETVPLYALAIYAKNERADLTSDQKRALTALTAKLKETARKST